LHKKNLPAPQSLAFTVEAQGRLNVLITDIEVSEAFNPSQNKQVPPTKTFKGIWDTGATDSVISSEIVKACKLAPITMVEVNHAGGSSLQNVYLVSFGLPNRVSFSAVRVTEGQLAGTDILIGMDIIGAGDFAVTNKDGKTMFSFRIPSLEHIDFVKNSNLITPNPTPIKRTQDTPRNAKCPCGSGKKYKHCCIKS